MSGRHPRTMLAPPTMSITPVASTERFWCGDAFHPCVPRHHWPVADVLDAVPHEECAEDQASDQKCEMGHALLFFNAPARVASPASGAHPNYERESAIRRPEPTAIGIRRGRSIRAPARAAAIASRQSGRTVANRSSRVTGGRGRPP